jgi:uncharacterized protein YkwD
MHKTLYLAAALAVLAAAPARADDINSFRRAHGLNALRASAVLMGIAYAHAHDMARRHHLDHAGFRARLSPVASAAAENVAYGCATQACAIRMWERSPGHRRNMLMRGISRYGIASATASDGRRYWVLELSN